VSTTSAPRSHHPNVRVERDGHVVTVTLDRPESKNACTGDMWAALGATFRDVSYSGARVVVLTGAGDNFCSGADLLHSLERALDARQAPAEPVARIGITP
jgi:enoyl-CoA hydratase/carnithine racemase